MTSPTSDDLLAELQRLGDQLDRPPSRADMQQNGEYSPSMYDCEFDSWGVALIQAGFRWQNGRRDGKIPNTVLLDELERIAETVHSPPRMDDMDEQGLYSSATYRNRFGSWKNAVRKAGLMPNKRGGLPPSREELLEELHEVAASVDGIVTEGKVREHSEYDPVAYRNRFGSLAKARREAGLDFSKRPSTDATRDELLEAVQRAATRVGDIPTAREFEAETPFTRNVLVSRFGSYGSALKAAGFERTQNDRIPRAELLQEVRRVADDLGQFPTPEQFEELGDYSISPYYERYESWSEVKAAVSETATQS